MSTVMKSPEYRKASPDGKATLLSEVKSYAYQRAKSKVLGADTPSIVERYDDAAKQGIGFCAMYSYSQQANGLSADKDANGESISGSKKAKVVSLIAGMNLTNTQKDYLYYNVAGYTDTKNSYAPWH